MPDPSNQDDRQPTDATPKEPEVVRTTIVGGRPPAKGRGMTDIPRGIEVLVKKASVDPEFKILLLDRREAAAEEIGLVLEPAEALMLRSVPAGQLEAIIASTKVDPGSRRTFLGKVAAAMLAAIAVGQAGCVAVTGARPDDPNEKGDKPATQPETQPKPPPAPTGIRPGPRPTKGARPDRPPRPRPTKDIRPEPPKPPPPPPGPTRGTQPDRP
jgi:hypothetical protein